MTADERLKAILLDGPTNHAWLLCLAALAARADPIGYIKAPSPEDLADWTGLSARWALNCIKHLKRQGWIVRANDQEWLIRTEPVDMRL